MVNTWKTGEKAGRAFGVFLAVEWNESTLDRHDVLTRVDIRERFRVDTLLQLQTRNLREFSGRENNHRLNVFLAGIEYHSSNKNRESSHYFHYQKNVFKRVEQITTQLTDTSRTFLPENLTDPEYISGQNRNISNLLRLNTRPNLISYKVYQNVKLSWMENDFLFFGLSARYSWDDINFDSEQSEIRESFNIDNATEVIYKDVALSEKKDRDWLGSGTFSMGYAIEVNPDDRFMFFIGVNPYLSMYKSRGYFLDVTGVIKTERTAYNPGIRMPLYGSYSFTDWFNIWGGGSINYYYNREKNENQLVAPVVDQGIGYNFLTNKNSTDNSSFRANKNIFLGFKASHKSGISANVDVRNEIFGRITNWFVTIGYSF